jgi:hypothetical protein
MQLPVSEQTLMLSKTKIVDMKSAECGCHLFGLKMCSFKKQIAWIQPNDGAHSKLLFFHRPDNTFLRLLLRRQPLHKTKIHTIKLEKKVKADLVELSQMNGALGYGTLDDADATTNAESRLLAQSLLAKQRFSDKSELSPLLMVSIV